MAFNYEGVDVPYDQYSREGNAAQWAVQAFRQYYGRDPSKTELAKAVPNFTGTDPNRSDVSGGNRYVASLVDQETALKEFDTKLEEQMQKQRQQQEADYTHGQDLLSQALQKQREAASSYYSPGNEGYQTISGGLNSAGLLHSGAFDEALAKQLGNVERDIGAQQSAGFAIPSLLSGQKTLADLGMSGTNTQMYPYQQRIQLPGQLQQRGFDMEDFYIQSQLASRLGEMQQQTPFQQLIGFGNMGSNIYGNVYGKKAK